MITDQCYGLFRPYHVVWAKSAFLRSRLFPLIDTACIVCGAGSMKRSGVRPSVCPIDQQQQRRVAGLLLSAQRPTDWR